MIRALLILTMLTLLITDHSQADTLNYLNTQNPEVTESKPESDTESGNRLLKITPIESCFSKLSLEEVNEIKKKYMKPYKECLKRVAIKEKEKNTIEYKKAEEQKKEQSNQTDSSSKK